MSSRWITPIVATALLAVTSLAIAQAPAASSTRIRGEIVSVSGDAMVVRRARDDVTIALKPDVPVAALKRMALADIRPGAFVGATAVPGADGHLVAREVHVFPEALRGRGEGHRDWDLVPGSSMTNANVDSVVQGSSGRTLTMSYDGGSKVIDVPDAAPVVSFVDATRADVVAGKKVFVIATQTTPGHYVAERITVEKDGVAPPM